MMKKRNVAVAMAAVTMAGTVAPVFANSVKTNITTKEESITTSEYSSLESKLKAVAGTKYTSEVLENVEKDDLVYNMSYGKKGSSTTSSLVTATDFEEAKKAISNSSRGDEFIFTIVDNGNAKDSQGKISNKGTIKLNQDILYKLRDGGKFNPITGKYDSIGMGDIDKNTYKLDDVSKLVNYVEATANNSTGEITLKFRTPEDVSKRVKKDNIDVTAEFTIVLKAGEEQLDFSKPKFTNNRLTGFEKAVKKIDPVKYVVTVTNAIKESMDVNGKDAKTVAEELNKQYVFKTVTKDQIKEVDGKFQLTLEVTNIKLSRAVASSDKVIKQVILKANTKAELEAIVDAINNTADFSKIVGERRIDTAIQVSSIYYNVKNGVNNTTPNTDATATDAVVLVNEMSIVDGLSAAPLAAAKKAPILLTKSDKLPAEVRAEIIRVMGLQSGVGANKTVYIVGGTSVVSEDIVKELEAMGLTVKRLGGDTRETTSVAVAKALNVTDKAYVVDGYKGIADAMSISPVAARDGKPVIVVNGNADLKEDVKKTLQTMVSSEIIGGTSAISKNVEKQIESAVISTTDRTEGINRQDTNAEVIKKHYTKVKSNNFFVAKDGMDREDRLVDALAIAPVAGKLNAPIVLNTNSLTTEQALAIDKVKDSGDKTLTQVGGGVAETVITQIKKVLGMK